MDPEFDGLLRFDCFELDVLKLELRRKGASIPIQPQPFKLLTHLALHAGETVSRETLHRRLWGDRTFVDFDSGLNFCICQIRKALGEDARNPTLLETLNRRGYRFLPQVERVREAMQVIPKERRIRVTLCAPGGLLKANLPEEETMEGLAEVITRLLDSVSAPGDVTHLVLCTLEGNTTIPEAATEVRMNRGLVTARELLVLGQD
jgi:DNA-binding winged helix-turn-helix (wHTH) protein